MYKGSFCFHKAVVHLCFKFHWNEKNEIIPLLPFHSTGHDIIVTKRKDNRGKNGEKHSNEPARYRNSVLEIVKNKSAENVKKVSYRIDCWDDDLLTRGNSLSHIALTEKGYAMAPITVHTEQELFPALALIGDDYHQAVSV